MAHWAELDENNIVIRVTVGDNNDLNGDEGYQWLIDNLGGNWVKTSYNSRGGVHYQLDENGNAVPSGKPHFRFNFAGKDYFYDEKLDAFIPPKPKLFDENGEPLNIEWILDLETCLWKIKQ